MSTTAGPSPAPIGAAAQVRSRARFGILALIAVRP